MTAVAIAVGPEQRVLAVRRARMLNRFSLVWNGLEAVVALAAGIAAGSVSLVGFGLDSVVEVSASVILAWRLSREGEDCTQADDRRATRAVAISFLALGIYVGIEATRGLLAGDRPDASVIGVALAAISLVLMPFVARAKRRVAPILGSQAQAAEANQTQLCAVLSGVLLLGLLANAVAGWWWADGVAALGIAALALREASRTWRAESLADTCCH
jgi:divalent metal cation (Fe/Co/Zn/Cd) transporter